LLQSVVIGFRAVYAAIALMAVIWLVSNVHQIAPDSQAVVMRLGRIDRTQEAGLLIAWPRPIEEVRLLPGPDRQLSQTVRELPLTGGIALPAAADASSPRGAPYLTGDGNVVLLEATLLYRITDAKAFVLADNHIAPALDRLFRATAVRVTAGHVLNDYLVVRTGNPANASITALRSAVRDELLKGMNQRLQELASANAGLGIEIQRIDMTALLPPDAKVAFDAVLTAAQTADQNVASARTEAEQKRQSADRQRDELIRAAQATASEMITKAGVDTATIMALAAEETAATRNTVLLRAYRDSVAKVMAKVGSVTVVDPESQTRLVLPGRE
jgi:regulator of protease activity HflC (stomatin/prohibitin superfamily)